MSATDLKGGDWIRGITIRQPWATCILAGKRTENRPANWPWRGWVLIHAGQKLEGPALRDPLVATAIRGRELHRGAVIGVARLIDCHPDQGPEQHQPLGAARRSPPGPRRRPRTAAARARHGRPPGLETDTGPRGPSPPAAAPSAAVTRRSSNKLLFEPGLMDLGSDQFLVVTDTTTR